MRNSPAFITVGAGPGLQVRVVMVGVFTESDPQAETRATRAERERVRRLYECITGEAPDQRRMVGRACKIRHDNGF
jgi:hypothetical protein